MISSKKGVTPAERKERVQNLRQLHQPYFDKVGISDALFIPKMAYRPQGKDELYISFFPSELENECDIYTEFVSIDYVSEDPKRTLYQVPHNPFWKDEYEIIVSNSGHARHFIPVNELKVIGTASSRINRKPIQEKVNDIQDLTVSPNNDKMDQLIKVLEDIHYTLEGIKRKMGR
tara:strand:+ start:3575 stop:4099 length:525 start_codon:yes stop_codon:yes gene_type:complete